LRADAAAAEDLFEEALQAVDWARHTDIDRERDEGVYVEPNVWTVHRPAMATWRDREPCNPLTASRACGAKNEGVIGSRGQRGGFK
jgi:hypothetical protein